MDPSFTDEHGNTFWLNSNGMHHRENGPAIEYENGRKLWMIEGKLHREDGPAIESDGIYGWFLNDIIYTFDAWLELTSKTIEEKVWLKLRYG